MHPEGARHRPKDISNPGESALLPVSTCRFPTRQLREARLHQRWQAPPHEGYKRLIVEEA